MKNQHKYKNLTDEQYLDLFSNYLMDRWSYSKVSSFARNEKAFEMNYVYNEGFKSSAASVAGSAYHKALELYFANQMTADIVELEAHAYEYIDRVEPYDWKLQKTTPTVESAITKASKNTTVLLNNFIAEKSVYEDEIKEVLSVEGVFQEFLTINGVDIPLPCKGVLDLVIKTINDKVVIIDHKSKTSFSDEKEIKFTAGKQAIVYYNLWLAATGVKADEVWIIENKSSKNRDGSPQLIAFKIKMDEDNVKLYEAILYESLKRMLEAISNPDYVYMINDADNFVNKAELYDFWARTQIAEVSDFDIPEAKKELITTRLRKIRNSSLAVINPNVIKNFRKNAAEFIQYDLTNKNMTREEKIEHVLRSLGMIINVAHTFSGYSSDTFLLEVSAGTNIASIARFKLDIASALSVSSIRMDKNLFVYEGKSYVSIEAEKTRENFLFWDAKYIDGLKIPLGKDNQGNVIRWDMESPSTPHVLVGGSTGSGKSVELISMLEYAKSAGVKNIIIFDPKYEFSSYGESTFNDIEDIEEAMEMLVQNMNAMIKSGRTARTLVIFDEIADAVASSKKGKALNVYENIPIGHYADGRVKTKREVVEVKKSLEENLRILLQKGRSVGFNIIAATQRASTKIVTGDLKVNLPVVICFRVPKEIDSRVMMDESGAESLAGKGDGLVKSPDYLNTIRMQSFYKK